MIDSEIWNNLFPNVQQRDKTLLEVQKVLGIAIVSMIALAEMFETNILEIKKAKKSVSDVIILACNAMYEMSIKRRYIKTVRTETFSTVVFSIYSH